MPIPDLCGIGPGYLVAHLMNEQHLTAGYELDICHFCGASEAGYARTEKGKTYDACNKCARAKFQTEEPCETSQSKS